MTGPLAEQFAQVVDEVCKHGCLTDEAFAALSVIERHVQDMTEAVEDFEHSLANWEAAYPTSVFGGDLTKEEQRAVTAALIGAGFTSDRVHASWGRHIVRCFTEVFAPVRAALPAREKGEE